MQRSLNHHLACQPWCCLHPSDVRVSLSSRHWQRVNILNWKRRELARWSFKSKLNDFIYCHVDRQVWEEKRKSFPHFISLMTFNPRSSPASFYSHSMIAKLVRIFSWILKLSTTLRFVFEFIRQTSPIFHRRRLAGGREWKMGRDFILHAAELIVDSSESTKYMSSSSNEKSSSK